MKNPIPGKTKTRLAKDVGNDKALAIYNSLLDYTRAVVKMVHAERYLYYSNEIVKDKWNETLFQKKRQSDGDLGNRMAKAFEEVLSVHDKALIIGSDCPQLDLMTISNAFSALDTHDYVIGPSQDGGYYLAGMRKYSPRIFEDMTWSTSSVCDETLSRIKSENKTYKLLQRLSDIDYKEDWDKYGWEI